MCISSTLKHFNCLCIELGFVGCSCKASMESSDRFEMDSG